MAEFAAAEHFVDHTPTEVTDRFHIRERRVSDLGAESGLRCHRQLEQIERIHADVLAEARVGTRLSGRDYNPYLSTVGTELERKIEADAAKWLGSVRQQLENRQIRVKVHFRRGRPDSVIADAARQIGCQLIVMGTRGKSGLSHVLLGSVAERTVRQAPCPVLTVRQPS